MIKELSTTVILDVLIAPNLTVQNYTAFLLCGCLVIASIYLAAVQMFSALRDKLGYKKKQPTLSRDILTDALTGLPNRVASESHFILQVQRLHQSAAIIVLDIDNFRTINDTLGYSKGDDVLKRFAHYLKNKCGSGMHVARLSGDEFIIVASGLDDLKAFKLVSDISDYIKSKDSSITVFDGEKEREYVNLSISAGISRFPEDAKDYQLLLKHADSAMMNVKRKGKNGVKHYQSSDEALIQHRQLFSRDLARAISKKQFSVVYQPIYDTFTRKVSKVEALLRWDHPLYGSVSPAEFIGIAETTGSIYHIGLWVIKRALSDLINCPDVKICINVSVVQLENSSFLSDIKYIMTNYQVAPGRLEFEITETLEMYRNEKIPRVLDGLDALGISTFIDDFGTGYSNFVQLLHMNVHGVKIDKSLIDMLNNRSSTEIYMVKSIIEICISLGFVVIAEGIEYSKQYELLRSWKCHFSQGYFLSKPLPPEMFIRNYLHLDEAKSA